VLFFFSLFVLGSLCPFCTAYYALSGICFYLFWRYGRNEWLPDLKVAGLWAAILLVGSFFMYQNTKEKEEKKNHLNTSVVQQYRQLPNLGEADMESPYKIHMATKNFADSPIRMTIFSDFQCPFCKVVSEQLPDLVRRYGDKLSIQYMFYPLDNKCNPNVKHAMHEYACSAAMLAACDPKKFLDVHDEIFAHQDQLAEGALKDIAARHNLTNCETDEMKNIVISTINQGTKFNLKSTPTIIVNGKKIEGSIPSNQFFAIFDDILSGQK
jgi:protein-disulfide isomerase